MFDVIVLDLDGTLLKDDKTVSLRTLRVLRECEEKGKRIIIATARPLRLGAVKLPDELQKEFMIFYNGAEIYHNKRRIYSRNISLGSANVIKNLILSRDSKWNVGYEINNSLYTNFKNDGIFGTSEYQTVDLERFKLQSPTKILLDMRSVDDIEFLNKNLPVDCCMVITDNGDLGQIVATGVNKVNALKFIVDKLQTNIERVMFFGDDINDIELITECGIGIAMGNADPRVKEAADYVTLSNEEDGVAEFLDNFYINC